MIRPTLTKIDPVSEDGWSDWITPTHERYLMGCCDCGLIHEMQFAVARQLGSPDEEGVWPAQPLDDPMLRVTFRARRHPSMEPSEEGGEPAEIIDDLLSLMERTEAGDLIPHPFAVRAAALIRLLAGEA